VRLVHSFLIPTSLPNAPDKDLRFANGERFIGIALSSSNATVSRRTVPLAIGTEPGRFRIVFAIANKLPRQDRCPFWLNRSAVRPRPPRVAATLSTAAPASLITCAGHRREFLAVARVDRFGRARMRRFPSRRAVRCNVRWEWRLKVARRPVDNLPVFKCGWRIPHGPPRPSNSSTR